MELAAIKIDIIITIITTTILRHKLMLQAITITLIGRVTGSIAMQITAEGILIILDIGKTIIRSTNTACITFTKKLLSHF
jgi:hypothetical protein